MKRPYDRLAMAIAAAQAAKYPPRPPSTRVRLPAWSADMKPNRAHPSPIRPTAIKITKPARPSRFVMMRSLEVKRSIVSQFQLELKGTFGPVTPD